MFRRLLVFFVVLSLALSFWTVPAAAKTETFFLKSKSLFAEAGFSTIDPTGCIETSVFVFAEEGRVKADGETRTETIVSIDISQFNNCTFESLFFTHASTTIDPEEFAIDKQLNQATLNTTIVVEEVNSGMTIPVEVNITWTGVGETSNLKIHDQFRGPGFLVNTHLLGTTRNAQASGTVTGLGINFTPEPAVFAQLANVKRGELIIVYDS